MATEMEASLSGDSGLSSEAGPSHFQPPGPHRFPLAAQPEIMRAAEKDDQYASFVYDACRDDFRHLFGLYYHISTRAAGIRYVFIEKPSNQRPRYQILGVFLLIQLCIIAAEGLRRSSSPSVSSSIKPTSFGANPSSAGRGLPVFHLAIGSAILRTLSVTQAME